MLKPAGLTLAILGAGPVGIGCAALAASRGHKVRLYSPRGGGTRGIGAALEVQGLLAGRFAVDVAADLGRATDGADAVLAVLPGHVQAVVLERLARVLSGRPAVFVAPAAALTTAVLARDMAARGLVPDVAALAAPPVAARRIGAGVWVGAIRTGLWMGTEAPAPRMADLATALFGMRVRELSSALAAALGNMAGLADAALLLGPSGVPDAPPRLVAALAAERDAIGRALRLRLPPADRYFEDIGGLPPLDEGRALGQGGMALAFLVGLGARLKVATPLASAALTVLETLAGRSLRDNPALDSLGEDRVRAMLQPA